jgi:hypothetical protein
MITAFHQLLEQFAGGRYQRRLPYCTAQSGDHAGKPGLPKALEIVVKVDGVGNLQPLRQPLRQYRVRNVGCADQHVGPEPAQAAQDV